MLSAILLWLQSNSPGHDYVGFHAGLLPQLIVIYLVPSISFVAISLFVLQFSFVLHPLPRICLISHKTRERVLYSRPAHFSPIVTTFAFDSRSGVRGQKLHARESQRALGITSVFEARRGGSSFAESSRAKREDWPDHIGVKSIAPFASDAPRSRAEK